MALHFAVAENNVEMIELLIAHGGDPEANKPRGYTILHLAALLGKKEVFKWIVRENILSLVVSWLLFSKMYLSKSKPRFFNLKFFLFIPSSLHLSQAH